jgi:hypothetical protein
MRACRTAMPLLWNQAVLSFSVRPARHPLSLLLAHHPHPASPPSCLHLTHLSARPCRLQHTHLVRSLAAEARLPIVILNGGECVGENAEKNMGRAFSSGAHCRLSCLRYLPTHVVCCQ